MAPRRRSKVGLTRMHAAVDAMRPMGFSRDVVRKSVRNLLKVYGEEGWAFIEEAAYKLLIDTLLEEPEVPRIEDTLETPLLEGGEHVSHDQPDPVHELCDKEIIFEDQEHASDIQEAETKRGGISIREQKNQELSLDVKVTPTLLQKKKISAYFKTRKQENFIMGREKGIELKLSHICCDQHRVYIFCLLKDMNIGGNGNRYLIVWIFSGENGLGLVQDGTNVQLLGNVPTAVVDTAQPQIDVLFDFAPTHTPQPIVSVPMNRKRKPCYGWISDDEDNEDDLLQLTPANCTSI